MASISHSSHLSKNHAYIYANVKNVRNETCVDNIVYPMCHDVVYASHAMSVSSSSASFVHGKSRTRHNDFHARIIHVPKVRNASHGHSISYSTYDASYVLYCKSGKVVASQVRLRHKNGKTCIWVPKSYVTNLTGHNSSWVPKPQA